MIATFSELDFEIIDFDVADFEIIVYLSYIFRRLSPYFFFRRLTGD